MTISVGKLDDGMLVDFKEQSLSYDRSLVGGIQLSI